MHSVSPRLILGARFRTLQQCVNELSKINLDRGAFRGVTAPNKDFPSLKQGIRDIQAGRLSNLAEKIRRVEDLTQLSNSFDKSASSAGGMASGIATDDEEARRWGLSPEADEYGGLKEFWSQLGGVLGKGKDAL